MVGFSGRHSPWWRGKDLYSLQILPIPVTMPDLRGSICFPGLCARGLDVICFPRLPPPERTHPGIRENEVRAAQYRTPHIYIRDGPISIQVKTGMADLNNNFWMGGGIGAVIIIAIDLMVPLMGPLIGGFVAGFVAKGGIMNAGKAGFIAGVVATMVIALVLVAGMASHPVAGYIPSVGTGYLLFITITLYLALFAFLGGIFAGAVRR
jgi:hypothetical protein